MKKLYPLLSVLFLIYFGCQDGQDTTPPKVTITSPQDGSNVYEIITITCMSSDNEGVEKVELWVNGVTTELIDNTEPYSFDWNTTTLEDGNYTIIVRSYDTNENTTNSESVVVTVDNTLSNPTPVELYPITYNDGFQISWSQNNDDDFLSYKLYESFSQDMSNQTLVYETDDRIETTYLVTIEVLKYYQITIEDYWGLQTTSNIEVGDYEVELWGEYYLVLNTIELNLSNSGLSGEIPSEIGNLTNLFSLNLGGNQFTGSIPPEIGNLTNLTILSFYGNEFTGSIPPEIGNLTNLTILSFYGNEFTGFIPSEIGNLINLTHLGLNSNKLSGTIPSEIGNLTNLIWLELDDNQLTGEIPTEICNLNIGELNYFNITNNQFCPPYPACIQDYVGSQDTSGCD